jgi:hypothetical protein
VAIFFIFSSCSLVKKAYKGYVCEQCYFTLIKMCIFTVHKSFLAFYFSTLTHSGFSIIHEINKTCLGRFQDCGRGKN